MPFPYSKLRCLLLLFSTVFFVAHAASAQKPSNAQPGSLLLPEKGFELSFVWLADPSTTHREPHAAMLLPVKLAGCPKQFYLQFDLGAPNTVFYKSRLDEIQQRYPKTGSFIDSSGNSITASIELGTMPVQAIKALLVSHSGSAIDWRDRNAKTIIGTLGADFIDNRVISINYPQKRFYNGVVLPKNLPPAIGFHPFHFMQRSVLLPASLRGKPTLLFFDTGSSAYELITDEQTAVALSLPNALPLQYPVRSWNRTLTANVLPTADSIGIAGTRLPLHRATYVEGASAAQIKGMMAMGIGGMTGNKLFLNCTLVLDVRAKKFAVVSHR